jgi:hypothetical protein
MLLPFYMNRMADSNSNTMVYETRSESTHSTASNTPDEPATNTLSSNTAQSIDLENINIDLRQPMQIYFNIEQSSNVETTPNDICQFILPNGKTLILNPAIIRKVSFSPKDTKSANSVMNSIDISYKDEVSIENLDKELTNISLALAGNTKEVEKWRKDNSNGISISGDDSDFRYNCSVIGEQIIHGKSAYPARIHYLTIDLSDRYLKKISKK